MIRVKDLTYRVGGFAISGLNLDIGAGEYFVLLGPPGAGKTVLVECLAGLCRIESGTIEIDGADVADAEPRHRGIGYVPQDFALFTHLTVAENIAFGLKSQALSKSARSAKTTEMAAWLGIDHLLKRSTRGLSGGERQRVALARALAMEPRVLLLDEPVSALDEHTRQTVCGEIKELQQRLGISVIHISHNQEEAFCVADRAAILNSGRLLQAGTMADLIRRPASREVARFMRCENIFPASFLGRDDEGYCVVRPESVQISREPVPPEAGVHALPAEVVSIADRGASLQVHLQAEPPLVASIPWADPIGASLKPGDRITAVIDSSNAHEVPK
jgi:ABC-type Fe3+/spermidine/putrescine transport system ATPase subunit